MTMDDLSGHVITLTNSIIGVSILAMPYCFKQCGILLSILLLLISSIISRLTCHYLLKSAILARRKTFEFLAFHIFGSLGKFCIEIGMIGFLLGSCIVFFVVMGDLGPQIVSEMIGARTGPAEGSALRNCILTALAVFCVLPLGLLKNVDSLGAVSKATICFYCCLVLKIVFEALPHIFTGDWYADVFLWRPEGLLQCLPIFSMALFCQTQLFEIYQAIPNASLEKMNGLIRMAVNICTWVYIFVGVFGYIAFFQKPFTGNILLSFHPSIISDIIKIGFVLSIAFSFPLFIFPCRQSLYFLLYKGTPYTSLHEGGSVNNYIPEGKFKLLTVMIVFVSLAIGILIPNVELVLGLIGSTIGVMICVIFPVTCFICISPKNTNERILAQIMLCFGVVVMVLGTYANLYAYEETQLNPVSEKSAPGILMNVPLAESKVEQKAAVVDIPTTLKLLIEDSDGPKLEDKDHDMVNEGKAQKVKEVRHEPPQPEEPVEKKSTERPKINANSLVVENQKEVNMPVNQDQSVAVQADSIKDIKLENVVNNEKNLLKEVKYNDQQGPVVEPVYPQDQLVKESPKVKNNIAAEPVNLPEDVNTNSNLTNQGKGQNKKNDEVDIEAIKKEESEVKEQEKENIKETEDHNKILIETIQKQNEVQKEIVEQQKKLLEVIQKQQENVNNPDLDKVNEEKMKAVKQIETIAKKAIESISGQNPKTDNKNGIQNNLTGTPEIKLDAKKAEEALNVANKKVAENQPNNDGKVNMEPIPIVLAKIKNSTKLNDPMQNKAQDRSKVVNNNENINSIRRDILSETDTRNKREVNDKTDEVIKLNAAVKQVCEEYNKLPSTERPAIKMLCQLSEPELVNQVDLNIFTNENKILIRPKKEEPGVL